MPPQRGPQSKVIFGIDLELSGILLLAEIGQVAALQHDKPQAQVEILHTGIEQFRGDLITVVPDVQYRGDRRLEINDAQGIFLLRAEVDVIRTQKRAAIPALADATVGR